MPHTVESISVDEITVAKRAYRSLIKPLVPKLIGDDRKLLDSAFALALDAHKFQRRKSGEPYILHPLFVAKICHEEIGLGPTAVI